MQRGACDGAQNNWDLVLALATDASLRRSARRAAPSGSGDPGPAAVRRHAAAVMDAVDRNGLVAPWTAVPHLLAMTTDPPTGACSSRMPPHAVISSWNLLSPVITACMAHCDLITFPSHHMQTLHP